MDFDLYLYLNKVKGVKFLWYMFTILGLLNKQARSYHSHTICFRYDCENLFCAFICFTELKCLENVIFKCCVPYSSSREH